MAAWKDSIVLLTSSDQGNPGFGTGFAFHRDHSGWSYVMTCLHVVETLTQARGGATEEPPSVLADGRVAEPLTLGNAVLDLAVLRVDGLTCNPLPLGEPIGRDKPILTAGYTQHEPAQRSVVSRPLTGTVRDNNPVKSLLRPGRVGAWSLDIDIDAESFRELTEGYSGSPVLNPETESVVGIMNLKWSGTKGHALCVQSCELFDPPLAKSLPDNPSVRPATAARHLTATATTAGALAWLASTLDHTDPIERVTVRLDDDPGGTATGPWFYAIQACLSDCPRTLAEHLAVRLGGRSPNSPWLDELVTELVPDRYDERGLWKALAAKITPLDTADRGQTGETDRILNWINTGSSLGPGGLRVVYCQLSVAEKGRRIPGFVAGAVKDFSTLRGIHPEARVLFLFACVVEESGLRGLLGRLRPPRLGRDSACETLGALEKVSATDVDTWLGNLARPGPNGRGPDTHTLGRLRKALEPLFPKDTVRLRYRQIQRPALDVLAQATLSDANSGDSL